MKLKNLFIILSTLCCYVYAMEEVVVALEPATEKQTVLTYSIADYFNDTTKQTKTVYLSKYYDEFFGKKIYTLVLNDLGLNSLEGFGKVFDFLKIEKSAKRDITLNDIRAIALKNNHFSSIDIAEILFYLPLCRKFYLENNPLAELKNIQELKKTSYLDIRSTNNDLKNSIDYSLFAQLPHSIIITNDKYIADNISVKQRKVERYTKHFGCLFVESMLITYVVFASLLLPLNSIQGDRSAVEMVDTAQLLFRILCPALFFSYMVSSIMIPSEKLPENGYVYGLKQQYKPHIIRVKDINS